MAVHVDPTAIVDPHAALDDDVSIGPYCVVSGGAFIGSGTRLMNHVTISGNVRIGHDNVIHPYCYIGGEPQDIGYKGEPTWVVIGDRNTIREMVTIHRGTTKEQGVTSVGSDNFIMGGCHFAHDVIVGSRINMANQTVLGGHVHVHDHAALSGVIAVHHFCTIGSYAFVGGMTKITMDVPPYMLADGNPAEIRCVNLVGLKRQRMSAVDIRSLTEAHRLLFRTRMSAAEARGVLAEHNQLTEPVDKLFAFLEAQRKGRNGRAREGLRAA